MTPAPFIDLLLKKYQRAPGFPFHDWTTDSVSFYALMSLWDEPFRTASGQTTHFYFAIGDAKMDNDSLILDVALRDHSRRVSVHPEPDGGMFLITAKPQMDGYAPDRIHAGYLPDRSHLSFASNIERGRLIAVFEMINTYTHAPLATLAMAEQLNDQFVGTYRHIFGFPDFDPFAGPSSDRGGTD
jgi:hypothetical protein